MFKANENFCNRPKVMHPSEVLNTKHKLKKKKQTKIMLSRQSCLTDVCYFSVLYNVKELHLSVFALLCPSLCRNDIDVAQSIQTDGHADVPTSSVSTVKLRLVPRSGQRKRERERERERSHA